jgi:hypothetical protein
MALVLRSAVVTPPIAIGTNLWFGGQSDPGSATAAAHTGALWFTVTLKVTEPVRPTLLVAEQVSVVVPIGKVAPELRGVQLTGLWFVPSTASTTTGVNATTAPAALVA